jgi:acyl-CoA reductase-like NAD-dependent aldehyde dehydrogenase
VQAARSIEVGPTDREVQPGMGPVITRQHRERVEQLIETGAKEGAKIMVDGRSARVSSEPNGFFNGATILDGVQGSMSVAKEEIFGPVLNVMRFDTLEEAIELPIDRPMGTEPAFSQGLAKRRANSSIASRPEWWALTLACRPRWRGFLSMAGMNLSSEICICKARKACNSTLNKK